MFKLPWVKTPRIEIPAVPAAEVSVDTLSIVNAGNVLTQDREYVTATVNKVTPIINAAINKVIMPLMGVGDTSTQLNKNSITMSQTFLQRIETGVQNFLNNVEKKLPTVLEEGAEFGLKYTALFQSWIDSGAVTDITTLVPATEPLKVEIDAILAQLKTAFTAIDSAFAKGTLFIAAGKIGQLQTGVDVPLSHVLLAVQAKYDTKTA